MGKTGIFKMILEIAVILLIFVIYRWLIYFIHEIGHFIVGKSFGYRCKITLKKTSIFMPRLATNIKGAHKLTVKQDLIFSLNGVLLAEIINIIFIFVFYQYKYIYLLVLIHIPIIFIDMIPDGNSDGKWVLDEIGKIFCLKDFVKTCMKRITFIIYFLLLLCSTIFMAKCYAQYYDNNQFIWYGLPIFCVLYFTSYRYIYRYIINWCKGNV